MNHLHFKLYFYIEDEGKGCVILLLSKVPIVTIEIKTNQSIQIKLPKSYKYQKVK